MSPLLSSDARGGEIARILSPYLTCTLPEGGERDLFFMDAALALARFAASEGEVPVGCVIARGGTLISGECNARETLRNPLWHAETAAIERASAVLGGWRLTGCTLYVTLEPCPMCAGAIINSRIKKITFGAFDKKAGSCSSVINLFDLPYNHKPETEGGFMEEECSELLSSFFKNLRKNK